MKSTFLLSLVCVVAGCSDGSSSMVDAGIDATALVLDAGHLEFDGSTETSTTREPLSDPRDPRADLYQAGMSRTGDFSLVRLTLVEAAPPPPFKGDTTWTLLANDLNGNPLTDLSISIVPRMPDHGHGSPKVPLVTSGTTPGMYVATPINLFMAGYWANSIKVGFADGRTDSLKFSFLIGD